MIFTIQVKKDTNIMFFLTSTMDGKKNVYSQLYDRNNGTIATQKIDCNYYQFVTSCIELLWINNIEVNNDIICNIMVQCRMICDDIVKNGGDIID